MKLINLEVSRYIVTEDWEVRVMFWKWQVAKFRIESLTGYITRK